MPTHPVYGHYNYGHKTIPDAPGYTINEDLEVMGIRVGRKKVKGVYEYASFIMADGKKRKKRLTHMALRAFFPHIDALETVDHIDEDHSNNHLHNLQWMTRSDNIRKSLALTTRDRLGASGKTVFELDGKYGRRYPDMFPSTNFLATRCRLPGNIAKSARSMGELAAGGIYFTYHADDDLPGEYWTNSPALDELLQQTHMPAHRKTLVSTKGRVQSFKTRKSTGSRAKEYEACRRISVRQKYFYVHQLVYAAFYNRIPPKRGETNEQGQHLVICHDDMAPKDEDGCYRNWACDLRLDTASANTLEFYECRKRKRN